jgi:hypothetical protein
MAALTTQNIVDAGTAPTLTGAASVSDTVEVGNGHDTFLYVANTDSVNHVIKIVAPGVNSYGQANPDPAITVVATTGTAWIPLRREYANAAVAGVGRATVNAFAADGTTPGATGVKYAVIRMG